MTVSDPFHRGTEGCTCLKVTEMLQAALSDQPPAPCEVHDPAAAQQARMDKVLAEHKADRDLRDKAEGILAGVDELDAKRKAKAEREAAIDALPDPMLRSLTRISGGPVGTPALNAPLSHYDALAPFLHPDGDDAA